MSGAATFQLTALIGMEDEMKPLTVSAQCKSCSSNPYRVFAKCGC